MTRIDLPIVRFEAVIRGHFPNDLSPAILRTSWRHVRAR